MVMSAVSASNTFTPSRMIVMRCVSANTSSSRCVMKRIATSRSRSLRTIAKSRSTSVSDKRGSRLVHDQHVRVQRQRLGNLDHLLVGNRQPAHQLIRAQIHAERRQQRVDLAAHLVVANPAEPIDAAAVP